MSGVAVNRRRRRWYRCQERGVVRGQNVVDATRGTKYSRTVCRGLLTTSAMPRRFAGSASGAGRRWENRGHLRRVGQSSQSGHETLGTSAARAARSRNEGSRGLVEAWRILRSWRIEMFFTAEATPPPMRRTDCDGRRRRRPDQRSWASRGRWCEEFEDGAMPLIVPECVPIATCTPGTLCRSRRKESAAHESRTASNAQEHARGAPGCILFRRRRCIPRR